MTRDFTAGHPAHAVADYCQRQRFDDPKRILVRAPDHADVRTSGDLELQRDPVVLPHSIAQPPLPRRLGPPF